MIGFQSYKFISLVLVKVNFHPKNDFFQNLIHTEILTIFFFHSLSFYLFYFTKTCLSVHITHSSVNFTWFALYNHQKLDDRPLFESGASFLTWTCFSVHITHSSVNFTWFSLYNHQKLDDRPLFELGASFLTWSCFSVHITHSSVNFTSFTPGWSFLHFT